jgi:hypothetical protein
MNDLLKCDFIDPLRNVKKSLKPFGRDCIWQIKEHLELKKDESHPKTAPITDEALEWHLKLFKHKMNMDTSYMNEYQRLLHKANNKGLTYEEKARFATIKQEQQIREQPKCTCYSRGQDCKCHIFYDEVGEG